jgi:hypothetical protein
MNRNMRWHLFAFLRHLELVYVCSNRFRKRVLQIEFKFEYQGTLNQDSHEMLAHYLLPFKIVYQCKNLVI